MTPILYELHWLPVEARIQFKILLTVYKCIHNLAPVYLSDLFSIKKAKRALRSNTDNGILFDAPRTKNKTGGDRAFMVYGAKTWNKLPVELRNCDNVVQFKKSLKTYLFKH